MSKASKSSKRRADAEKVSWDQILGRPIPLRSKKPRTRGLTMVMDRSLGVDGLHDIFSTGAEYVDQIKVGFGTAVLHADSVLAEKVELIRHHGIDVYPGGTLFELAFRAGQHAAYFRKIAAIGFNAVEISDGSIVVPEEDRESAVKMAVDLGFKVITEVGKKDPGAQPTPGELIRRANADFRAGAHLVTIEARESGLSIGIFDKAGDIVLSTFERLAKEIEHPERVIWEAPGKKQQVFMINNLGAEVNLGNIDPKDILSLETLRQGLRWDTLAA